MKPPGHNILQAISGADGVSKSVRYLIFPLLPLAITIPFALLIKSLRKEIFKWGAHIEVNLENGKDWKYETQLTKYMTKYLERESFNPIANTYFALSGLCFVLSVIMYFYIYKFPLSFPNCL